MTVNKNLLLSFIFLFFASLSFTQVPLKPLFEMMTSSTCGPCFTANQTLDGVLDKNLDTHSAIKYQVDFPGVGDPYFIEACRVRTNYYGVQGVPNMFLNGADENPFAMTQNVYDGFLGEMTNMGIEIVSATISADYIVDLEININAMGEYAEGLKTHVAIVEKKTVNNFKQNGETEFFNVLMQMLPNGHGTTLSEMTAGQTETFTFSHDMNETFMEGPGDLQVVVFVQDNASKEIIQSENRDIEGSFSTYNVSFEVEDSDGNIVDGAEVFLSNNGTEYTDADGIVNYNEVYENTTLDYVVSFPGLVRSAGTVTIENGDIVEPVIMEIPNVFYYEDFETSETTDWFPIFNEQLGADRAYWFGGKWIIFRQSDTFDPLYLASPGFDLKSNNGGTIVFNMRAKSGDAEIGFGTMSDPNDMSTMNEINTFFHQVENTDYEYDLSALSDVENAHFYWRTKTSEFSWYELDYVFITAGGISSTDKAALSETKVYPNPASNMLNIEMDLTIETVFIFDAHSKLVKRAKAGSNKKVIEISDLASGFYTIKIKSDAGTFVKPVIIK